MDDAKARFLFTDRSLDGFDPDDDDDRAQLLDVREELNEGQRAVRVLLADQIAGDDPAAVWATAQRLLRDGLDRDEAMDQLALVLAREQFDVLDGQSFDLERYVDGLEQLPLPTRAEVAVAFAEARAWTLEGLVEQVARRFSFAPDDQLLMAWLVGIADASLEQTDELTMLYPDLYVHRAGMSRDIVLTHQLTDAELHTHLLDASFDLDAFHPPADFRCGDGPLEIVITDEEGLTLWRGPDGWLSRFSTGDLVAVRVSVDGLVTIEPVATSLEIDGELAETVSVAYAFETSEYAVPIDGADLTYRLLVDHPDLFREPRPPLTALCEAGGLFVSGGQVASDPGMFDIDLERSLLDRITERLGRDDQIAAAMEIMAAYWESRDGVLPLPERRALLSRLQDGEVLDVVLREITRPDVSQLELEDAELEAFFGDDDVDEQDALVDDASLDREVFSSMKRQMHEAALRFTESLVDAASKSRDVAVARYAAAVAAEEAGETLVAEQHLHLAHQADPDHPMVIDRCAWYAYDRGDAATAARLWHLVSTPEDNPDLGMAERFAESTAKPLGRNEPCWCGSGRKYKQCHLGKAELPPLPDRVSWLVNKAEGYIERAAGMPNETLIDLAMALADDPDDIDSLKEVFQDPMLVDLVLVEEGYFELFLDDRGPLLPDDEAMLAASWLLVDRTVYEITENRPGRGMTLRDLRTGDELEVRERTFSRSAEAGQLFCGRAVPDGETHQLIGGRFPVRPGRERALLELLDEGEADEIAAWVGGTFRAPQMQTRDGETLVLCNARVETNDAAAAKAFLDRRYVVDGPRWVELYQLNDQEQIRRAGLELDGSIIVVEAQSEPRMDRVIDAIVTAFPDAKVLLDERVPADVQSFAALSERGSGVRGSGEAPIDPALLREGLREFQEQQEERWCDEPIPALDGMTPREAAADPTRRGDLERLLASFPEPPEDADYVSQRPSRLRELLGLDD